MLEMLNVLEGYDLRAMKHNSADYIHTLTETMKLAFADRDRYYGDPDFVSVPAKRASIERLRSDAQSLDRRTSRVARAAAGRSDEQEAADQQRQRIRALGQSTVPEAERANDTTCVNVIDKDGNLFSATPSGAWLPAVVAGDTGVLARPAHAVVPAGRRSSECSSTGQATTDHAHPNAGAERRQAFPGALDARAATIRISR